MSYVKPTDVRSPKDKWVLVDVLLDRGERKGAYAIGLWEGEPRIGFRWNGGGATTRRPQATRLGNPQSRGLPTWTMLSEELHQAVLDLSDIPEDKRLFAKHFLSKR